MFFTVLIGAGVQGFAPAMIGWLALKLAANWTHRSRDQSDNKLRKGQQVARREEQKLLRGYAFTAIVAGLVSMLFAAVGGFIVTAMNG